MACMSHVKHQGWVSGPAKKTTLFVSLGFDCALQAGSGIHFHNMLPIIKVGWGHSQELGLQLELEMGLALAVGEGKPNQVSILLV